MIAHINEENFVHEVLKSSGLVIVDFSAKWCGPCKMLSPVLEKISNENKDVRIVKIDVDESPKVVKRYGIRSIPMLIFFKNGRAVDEIVGFVPKERINEAIIENL
ncbi:MAG: thioredoxin [Clostridium butyricum]